MGERIPGVGKRVTLFDVGVDSGINCPAFHTLHWARGCSFSCSYCYLQRTFRRLKDGKAFHEYDSREVIRHVDQWLMQPILFPEPAGPALLNAGELADSLGGTSSLLPHVASMFTSRHHNPHRRVLLLLTKGASDRAFQILQYARGGTGMGLMPGTMDRIIVSATLNAPQFIRDLEVGTPPVENRLAMLKGIKERWPDVRIRVRIDPILGAYDDGYQWLCDQVRDLGVDLVTLGSFRLYPQDRGWFKDAKVWASLGKPDADGRRRPGNRLRWYVDLADRLVGVRVGLCKEPIDLLAEWGARTGRTAGVLCNCWAGD